MFQTAGYPTHPPYFDFQTPPRTPTTPATAGHHFYSPRHFSSYAAATPPPPRGHSRRSTHDYSHSSTYSTPRPKQAYYPPQDYSSPGYVSSAQSTPLRKPDYVPVYSHAPAHASTPAPTESKTRPRRASYTSSKTPTQEKPVPPPPRRPTSTSKPPPARATAEDARRAGIPAGYSYKNWDPAEEPILLLGSVFDANSLGKWIYDWTVFANGPGPISDMAGELWLLLIELAGKIQRGEEGLPRIRQAESREMIDDFLESGERLWHRFNKLLKICEGYMWRAARREAAEKKRANGNTSGDDTSSGEHKEKITMGRKSGCEFVDALFGRDRELENTEKFMASMRLWSMRFDANCEEILRNPTA